ncbi:MAG: ABC transporter permease [Ignavibacteriales bacterium]|nr:ABC transporter permease [Ignavibacteriales bacterium]
MNLKSINKIIIREFKRIKERRTLYLLEIILPLIVFFLFAEIYKEELVHDLPIAILDNDNTSLSRKVTRLIDSSPTMNIVENLYSIENIKLEFKKGNIQAAFVIPKKFEKDVKSGKGTTVIVYKNSTNILVSNYIYKESAQIIKTISGGVLLKKLKSTGLNNEKAFAVINPIKIETASLYNSNYSYENYLVPGLLTFSLQMMIMLSAVIVISSEFSHNTFHELMTFAENKAYNILIGKSIPHLIIHAASIILIIGVVFPIYNIKINGSYLSLILLMFVFVFASFLMGLFISAILNDQFLATEVAVFINTPAFIFSGFTFPIWAMPQIHRMFAQLLPFTHFLNAFLKVYQMGAENHDIYNELAVLGFFSIISIIGILTALQFKMHKLKEIYESVVGMG